MVPENHLRLGQIVGFHGLKGEIKVHMDSADAAWLNDVPSVLLSLSTKPEQRKLKITHVRQSASHAESRVVYLCLEDADKSAPLLNSRTAVESFLGGVLYVDQESLPDPEADEYWMKDLVGLTVIDQETRLPQGVVKDILIANGADFLEIQPNHSGPTVIAPFVDPFFPKVDLQAGQIEVTGLQELFLES